MKEPEEDHLVATVVGLIVAPCAAIIFVAFVHLFLAVLGHAQ